MIFRTRPSALVGLFDDPYAAFCLDEACAVVINRLRAGDQLKGQSKSDDHTAKTDEQGRQNLLDYLREFEQKQDAGE